MQTFISPKECTKLGALRTALSCGLKKACALSAAALLRSFTGDKLNPAIR